MNLRTPDTAVHRITTRTFVSIVVCLAVFLSGSATTPAAATGALSTTEFAANAAVGNSSLRLQTSAEPVRAAFFYPWFPNAWRQGSVEPFTNFTPSLGQYDSSDPGTINQQLALAKEAHIDVFIASWWGPGHHTDQAMPALLATTTAAGSPHASLDWAVYYEEEGQSDPSAAAIASDLTYLKNNYFGHPGYLKIDGKPVVFLWTASSTDQEEMLIRWRDAEAIFGDDVYIVPKVYSGYRDSTPQPESWHQYGPASASSAQLPYSYSVSPGFWLMGETERLARDAARFEADVVAMNNSGAAWQLITTWNEWGEGTSVEPANEFGRTYIDILAAHPPPAQAQPPAGAFVFTAGGDHGVSSRTDVILDRIQALGPEFHLALGDLSYSDVTPESAWCDYVTSHLGTTPVQLIVGNHEDDDLVDGHIDNFAACLPDRFGSTGRYGAEYYFDVQGLMRVIMIGAGNDVGGVKYDYIQGNARYQWLEDAIDDARSNGIPWITVAMHKPCLTAGQKSCEVGQDVIDLLIEKDVDLVLHGHDHNYQRSKQLSCVTVDSFSPSCVVDSGADDSYRKGRGPVFVIAGLMGTGLYAVDPADAEFGYFAETLDDGYGFLQVSVSRNKLDVEFVGTSNGYSDTFEITTSAATLPGPGSASSSSTDFDGDGRDDVFWYGPGSGFDYLWYGTSTRGTFAGRNIDVTGTYIPLSGDFNGDGNADVFWYGPGSGFDYLWYGTSTRGKFIGRNINVTGTYNPVVNDFDGDGRDDVFWYGPGSGFDYLWYGTSTRGTFTGRNTNVTGTYIPLSGDFNGDGNADVFWYGPGSGFDYLWYGTSTRGTFTGRNTNVTGTYNPVVNDFDGDGRDDVFWYGPGSGFDYLWYGTSTRGTFTGRNTNVTGTYTPLSGDFNGDGNADVFWYGPGSGFDYLWYGTSTRGTFTGRNTNVTGTYDPPD